MNLLLIENILDHIRVFFKLNICEKSLYLMDAFQTVYLDTRELSCPVCHEKYDLSVHYPMSLHCGHNIYSPCLEKSYHCPVCHETIANRQFYSKNLLLCSLLEQRKNVQECRKHHRSLDFYCKDDQQLICVDCGFKDGHFKHDVIQTSQLDEIAEDTKGLIKKIDQKDEEIKKEYKKFLENKKMSLKRELDEVIDEFIEPLIALKKKLHKETDSFIFQQNELYDDEVIQKSKANQWKRINEELVLKWDEGLDASRVMDLLNNNCESEEIKHNLPKKKRFEEKVCEKIARLQEEFKCGMEFMRNPWEDLKPQIQEALKMHQSIDPAVEIKYLEEYLTEQGLKTTREGEEILLKIEKGERKEEMTLKEMYFECNLPKLKFECAPGLDNRDYDILWGVLRKIQDLKELDACFNGLLNDDISKFGKAISCLILENISIKMDSKLVSEKGLHKLWDSLYELENLEKVIIIMKNSSKAHDVTLIRSQNRKKLLKLKEVDLQFLDSEKISEEGLGWILKTLKGCSQITKFNLAISDCSDLQFQPFESLCQTLSTLVKMEEFGFVFEGFYEFGSEELLVHLSDILSNLKKINKLKISFARDTCLSEKTILKFVGNLCKNLPKLSQFSINLSECTNISDQTLINLGILFSKIVHLTKLELTLRECEVSNVGVSALMRQLKRLSKLKSLYLDFSECHIDEKDKITDLLQSFAGLEEKTVLLTSSGENSHFQQPQQRRRHPVDFFASESDDSLTFEPFLNPITSIHNPNSSF